MGGPGLTPMLRDALVVVACLLLLEATRAGDCNELVGNYSGRLVEHQTLAIRLVGYVSQQGAWNNRLQISWAMQPMSGPPEFPSPKHLACNGRSVATSMDGKAWNGTRGTDGGHVAMQMRHLYPTRGMFDQVELIKV